MTTVYCDACGKKIKGVVYAFVYLTHIDMSKHGCSAYEDLSGNRVSGRTETKDVCLECYNKIYGSAYKTFQEIDCEVKS